MKPEIEYPCRSIPEDAPRARLLGLYPQRQEGLWMQRIRVPGGAPDQAQWHALADAARTFTPQTPLHLTTRQDVEFHDVPPEDVPALQAMLAEEGLTGIGACGDTLRNVTVCPCSGARRGCPDLHALALEVKRLLHKQEGIFALPRKFKISFSACAEGCAQPFINDLAFVAAKRADAWGFRVIGAGSLGPRPATGIPLFEFIPATDVLPLVVAAVRVFAEHGDREHRGRARLRHVRERVGDAAFTERLAEAFARATGEREWLEPEIPEGREDRDAKLTLHFADGNLWPNAADALGELNGGEDVLVRVGNNHDVHLFGRDEASLRSAVSGEPSLRASLEERASVVACPGVRWCSRGIVDTCALAGRIREELGPALAPDASVRLSGCPNGCAQHAVAEIGLTGGLATRDGARVEVWTLVAGGGMGRTADIAHEIARGLTADEVIAHLQQILSSTSAPSARRAHPRPMA